MKNNFKALVMHLLIMVFSHMFLFIFVATAPKIGQYTAHIISRIFIGISFLLAYVLSGTLLDTNTNKKYDFLAGVLVAAIGASLWIYTMTIAGGNLLAAIPEELSEYWILTNIYHLPFVFVRFLFGLPSTPLSSLVMSFLPTVLMGLGLKYKRLRSANATGSRWLKV